MANRIKVHGVPLEMDAIINNKEDTMHITLIPYDIDTGRPTRKRNRDHERYIDTIIREEYIVHIFDEV